MHSKLPWKSVWITGAGRGIGKALALLCVEKGMTVYASSRTISDLISLEASCKYLAGVVIPLTLDITDTKRLSSIVDNWDQGSGIPDLVILNAGTHDPFAAQSFCAQRCKDLLDINLQGTINCLDPMLTRMLIRNSGQIAVMSSVAGYRGLPTAAAYGASKAALINLCEALRLDLSDTNIKLQVINPGFIRTSLTAKNDFKMPAIIEPEAAAEIIFKGLLSSRFEIAFPGRFIYFLKLLRIFPYSWYFKLITKSVKI
jgi:short-subunit dehydrogenase